MEFIKKLLGRKQTAMISLAEHEGIVDEWADQAKGYETAYFTAQTQLDAAERDLKAERAAVAILSRNLTTARAEAAANAADAKLWRDARDKRKRSARPRVKAEVA